MHWKWKSHLLKSLQLSEFLSGHRNLHLSFLTQAQCFYTSVEKNTMQTPTKKSQLKASRFHLCNHTLALVSLKGCCNMSFLVTLNKYLGPSIINGGCHMQSWVGSFFTATHHLLSLRKVISWAWLHCCGVKLLSFLCPHSLAPGVK